MSEVSERVSAAVIAEFKRQAIEIRGRAEGPFQAYGKMVFDLDGEFEIEPIVRAATNAALAEEG